MYGQRSHIEETIVKKVRISFHTYITVSLSCLQAESIANIKLPNHTIAWLFNIIYTHEAPISRSETGFKLVQERSWEIAVQLYQ